METANTTTATTATNTEYVELPAQAFIAKILNKPGRGGLNGLISSFPAIKVFTSNAVPLLVPDEPKEKK